MAKRSKDPIEEIKATADEAVRKIQAIRQREKSMHVVEDVPVARRGPKPGSGGRPPKAGVRKLSRGIQLLPSTWEQIEAQRLPNESLSDAVERFLLAGLKPPN